MEQTRGVSLRNKNTKLVRDISESLGKLPPQDTNMEQAILGALMLQSNGLNDVAGFLRPDHFYSEQNKQVYQAIQDIYAEGDPVDMRTVVARLRKNGKLELVGGPYYIAELTSKVSSSTSVEYHVKLIQELYLRRQCIQIASEMHYKAYSDTDDVFEMISSFSMSVEDVMDKTIGSQTEKTILELSTAAVKEMQAKMSGHFSGQKTGFDEVDRILNGSQNGDLVILAARPAQGKTALFLQIMKQIADQGLPVGAFSLEMPAIQLIFRLACNIAEIESDKVQKGTLDEYEWAAFMEACGKISKLPMHIDDSPMLNIIDIRARARRWKIKHGIKALFIDYLQLIKVINEKGGHQNRDQEIAIISRTLKAIAKELEIPVFAISSLSREVEKRGGAKRPQLSDLREGGSIEFDADVVMFLYRPEVYGIKEDEDGMPTHGKAEVIVAKHRNGSLGTAVLNFIGRFTKFQSWISDAPKVDYVGQQKSPLPKEKEQENLDSPF